MKYFEKTALSSGVYSSAASKAMRKVKEEIRKMKPGAHDRVAKYTRVYWKALEKSMKGLDK